MKIKDFVYFLVIILFCFNVLFWFIVFDLNKENFYKIVFFNVGQGDAIFIESLKKQRILIDGGPDSTILNKLAKEMPFYDRTIDLIILTHPEIDHLTGLNEVLKKYKIENIIWTGVKRETHEYKSEYKKWLELIKEEGANIKLAQKGISIKLNDSHLDILYPFENLENQEVKNNNDSSIVSQLFFKNNVFLFTGDISGVVEKKLLAEPGIQIKSDVLKISHHGSRFSSEQDFLEKVSPKIAVISVGKNFYGHPTKEVLSKLDKLNIKFLRTDQNGDIKIKCQKFENKCFVGN